MEKILLAFIGLALASASGINQVSVLKKGLLAGYDKTVKPEGVTKVKVGHHVLDLDLCPHKQVCSSAQRLLGSLKVAL